MAHSVKPVYLICKYSQGARNFCKSAYAMKFSQSASTGPKCKILHYVAFTWQNVQYNLGHLRHVVSTLLRQNFNAIMYAFVDLDPDPTDPTGSATLMHTLAWRTVNKARYFDTDTNFVGVQMRILENKVIPLYIKTRRVILKIKKRVGGP
jgi:hypothetical protein